MRTDYDKNPPQALIVDDEPDIIGIYRQYLEHAGYTVEIAGNGSEADFKVSHKTFDVIITDINMPYIDGVDFIKNVKAGNFNKTTPIVVISGFLSKHTVVKLATLQVTKIYTKPIKGDLFVREVNEIIGLKGSLPSYKETKPDTTMDDELEVK